MFKRVRWAIFSGLLPLAASLVLLAWALNRRRERSARPARIVLPVTGLPEEEQMSLVEVRVVPEQAVPEQAVPEQAAPEQAAPEQAAPEHAGSEQAGADDLTRIEGIGPKIAAVLQAAGVRTFAQLAALSVDQIKAILEGRVRIARPDTWPEQAALAAAGDWDGLTALQNALKGGRRM